MAYLIRPAAEKDCLAVYNYTCMLEESNFNYTVFESLFKENIRNKNYVYLVVTVADNDSICGFISCHAQNLLHHCGKVAEIQELFIAEPYRGSGLGNQLIEEVEKRLKQMDCVSFEVTAQHKRTATHRFYERNGFKHTHQKFVKQLQADD